jgi:selenocysteine-specific translation elongation factor
VTVVVLNQIDLVAEHARRPLAADLVRLLRDDGLGNVRVIATSTRTGDGVSDLRRELAARVAERRAVVARLLADVDQWRDQLRREVGRP